MGGVFLEGNGEKKIPVIAERILDCICLAASYGILFLLPQKTDFLFYLVFGIAAFLFCIGFFRLGFTFDAPEGEARTGLLGLLYAVFGIILNAAGQAGIFLDSGSGRSITIATLLLIEALLLYAMAASGVKDAGRQRALAILLRAAAIIVVLLGIALTVWKHFDEPSVVAAAMLLIEGICLWKMGGGSNPFNTVDSEVQSVPGMRIPIEQLNSAFADVRTQLGYSWTGKIKTIKKDAVIYGPSEDGFVVYGYYSFGRFYVSGSTNLLFPHPEDAQSHLAEEMPDSNGILLAKENLPKAYAEMFARYAQNGEAKWSTELSDHS